MNRNSKILSIFAMAFALALSFALAGCGQQASSSAASSSASSASASASAAASSSAASESASASSASATSASASASSASAAAADGKVSFSMKIDATEAGEGILFDQSVTMDEGTTVYQALVEANLPLAVDSSSGSAYVYGIGNAIVSDKTPTAGWLFYVNGETPSVGADKVVIANGDVIEWKYVEDYTKVM